ncbi:hypothetical protein EXU85_00260 [Spirosoma sp. KCTC 42546]|uniref:hypothetical protein n=1 Tax=Spirosoma sp. KCTC 42546 TaxID=2520506 RepID=UPI001157C0E7|nr:hypothetical protein [Spirosoma sp. KCTC 42546]QDK77111.1 hypothetical protein EXU85_00260 [Spirosoma sp. KCTC 42546]
MDRKLNWLKEAFSRDLRIMQQGQVVGGMHRDVLSRDVEAYLNSTRLRFDVTGFLIHSVNIHDLNAGNQIIGHIAFSFGKRAELKLTSGESYLWKRPNMLMREWDMIREAPDGSPEKELVSYDLTRQFFKEAGDISVNEDEQSTATVDIIILTGLFIRNYFQRRRRIAAGAIAATT